MALARDRGDRCKGVVKALFKHAKRLKKSANGKKKKINKRKHKKAKKGTTAKPQRGNTARSGTRDAADL